MHSVYFTSVPPCDMTVSFATTDSAQTTIPSAQVIAEGEPRFLIPSATYDPAWSAAANAEAAGGVSAEIRTFLDAQLESGDVVLDLAPGFGFVALSAATSPAGMPTVLVEGLPPDRLQLLQDSASDAGGWLDEFPSDHASGGDSDLARIVDARLDTNGRLFVHLAAADVNSVCERLQPLFAQGRVLALCITDAERFDGWETVNQMLVGVDFVPCELVERNGEAEMVRVEGEPLSPVIALPSVFAPEATSNNDMLFTPIFSDQDVKNASATSAPAATHALSTTSAGWLATRDGFSFIAPHSRTGYGVTGAHLLRALQQRGVPVAYFPLGPIDRTIADNPRLPDSLALQGAYRDDVPSVRLSQQFDLAMHVGRGPRIGFTIFERNTFTAREMHHLQSQDAILVCSNWARQVCIDNGLTEQPIHVVPLGVDRTIFHGDITPAKRWPETVFLQVGKLETRKGQLELLRAFEDAFTPKDAVRLVLACGNPFISRTEMDTLLKPFRKSPMSGRITMLTNELPTQHDVAQLMAAADCGVFAARAEGWNLEALEILSMGKQVIATDYSAHTEFLTADNARLIAIDALEPAMGGQLTGQWAAWGASQHEQLVAHLRDVHASRVNGTLGVNEAGIETARVFSWDASADALLRALASQR